MVSPAGYAGNRMPGYNQMQTQEYTPEQMDILQRGYQSVGPDSYTARLAAGDPDLMNEMEMTAKRQFSGMQGQTASRFSRMGGTGGRKSSGFQNTMNQASSDFAQDLQSRRQELQRGAVTDLHNMSNSLLEKRPYQQYMQKKKKPWWKKLISGGAAAIGGAMAGPVGAWAGGAASDWAMGD